MLKRPLELLRRWDTEVWSMHILSLKKPKIKYCSLPHFKMLIIAWKEIHTATWGAANTPAVKIGGLKKSDVLTMRLRFTMLADGAFLSSKSFFSNSNFDKWQFWTSLSYNNWKAQMYPYLRVHSQERSNTLGKGIFFALKITTFS